MSNLDKIDKFAERLLRLHHPGWYHETFEVNVFPKDVILKEETKSVLKEFLSEIND